LSPSDPVAFENCRETSAVVALEAIEIATTHRFSFRDGAMLAAAAQSNCRVLLSEDMQHGFTWRGVTIRDPHESPHLVMPLGAV
jgi:predicted nucleic acid-binding protein